MTVAFLHQYWGKNITERYIIWLPFPTVEVEQVAVLSNEAAHAALNLFKSQKFKARKDYPE